MRTTLYDRQIAEWRANGWTIVQCIRALAHEHGLRLGEAKDIVHLSPAWADRRGQHDAFHEIVEMTFHQVTAGTMFLIGQYDSPFVRRVGIALNLYGIAFEQKPWSTFADAEKVAVYNPLRRVPTLVLDSGEVLIESAAILDWLDEQVEDDQRLIADHGPDRRRALKIAALGTGLADKAVILFYEGVLHKEKSDVWVKRCRAQIADVLDALEAERAAVPTTWWFGERIGHADIAVACALRFVRDVHPDLFGDHPALVAHAERCEALPVFAEISQAFSPPA